MTDLTNQGCNDDGKIRVYIKRREGEVQPKTQELVESAKAHVASTETVIEKAPPAIELARLFLTLWEYRKSHGVLMRANPAWEKNDRPYSNLTSFKLPCLYNRFYYVENDLGRNLVIMPLLLGNLVVCYRVTKEDFCVDYVIPNLGFKHQGIGERGNQDHDRNFIMASMTDLLDKIMEPPTFMPLF